MSFGEKVKIDLNKSSKILLSTKVFPDVSSIEVFSCFTMNFYTLVKFMAVFYNPVLLGAI